MRRHQFGVPLLPGGLKFFNLLRFLLRQVVLFADVLRQVDEQRQIASVLLNVDMKMKKERENSSTLRTLKTGLMQKLLTGQIRVKV